MTVSSTLRCRFVWDSLSHLVLLIGIALVSSDEAGVADHRQGNAPEMEGSSINDTTPASNLTRLDYMIHSLEQRLETDLHRVESDAHEVEDESAVATKSSTKRSGRDRVAATVTPPAPLHKDVALDQDLSQVRTDIQDLIQSIVAAEQELLRLRAQVNSEERKLKHKTANMKTEQILDDLHRGKLNLKVDYVTGRLVTSKKDGSGSPNEARSLVDSMGGEVANMSNGNAGMLNISDHYGGISVVDARVADEAIEAFDRKRIESGNKTISESEARARKEESEEQALENIIEAALHKPSLNKRISPGLEDDKQSAEEADGQDEDERQMDQDLQNRVKKEIESLRTEADPAVMTFNVHLLVDIVQLAITAAFFGLVAVFFRLPPTAGFLLGGMIIGPSFLDVIGEIHAVHTLAQFGSIFLLFEQGLLYSQMYSGSSTVRREHTTATDDDKGSAMYDPGSDRSITPKDKPLHSRRRAKILEHKSSSALSADAGLEHDPNLVGTIVLILLIFTTLAIVVLTDVVSSVSEAVTVACSIAVCSTTIVSENLDATNLARTPWGYGVLKMIAMHDLFMIPLLALPELLSAFVDFSEEGEKSDGSTEWNFRSLSLQIILVAVFFQACLFLGRHVVAAANYAQSRMKKGELFTLSIVAYALLISSMSAQLKLSIEAGAVLAGIALIKSPHVPQVLASISSITSVFGGMYMTSLGMIISPSFVGEEASSIVQLVVLIGLFKLALVSTTLNRCFDYGITSSLAVGSAMAQISETSLVVLAKGQRIGLVSRKTYLLLIPTTCILLSLAPFSAAHLRRLKMQEVTGSDDGKVPHYLCFLTQFGLLRQPNPTGLIPLHESTSHDSNESSQHRRH